LELDAGILDRLGCEEPRRHRALAVAHAVADQYVALAPAGVEDRVGGVSRRPPLVLVDRGVEMAVEAQAAPAAGARQGREDVRSIGIETDLARFESLTRQPIIDIFCRRTLAAGGAVEIGEIERHFDELVSIDFVDYSLGIDCHCWTLPVRFVISG